MLVLTRKPWNGRQDADDAIVRLTVPPGDTETVIDVVVVRSTGNKARVGVTAPERVAIDRADCVGRRVMGSGW